VAEATEKTAETTETADKKCSKEGCKRPYRAKGYCVTHYKLWRRGELEGHKARYKICSKEACKKSAGRYGLCDEHRGTAPKEGEAAAPTAG
jgi:hypothetical protein